MDKPEEERGFLSRVWDEDAYSKVKFSHDTQANSIAKKQFDRTTNIDSFAEMDGGVARGYLDKIDGVPNNADKLCLQLNDQVHVDG